VYKTYLRPQATDHQILRAGQYSVVGFAVFMAGFASLLHGVNIDLGFIYVSDIAFLSCYS
jgi:Na+/proline symporter